MRENLKLVVLPVNHRLDSPSLWPEENLGDEAGDEFCRLLVENGIIFNYDYSNWKREEWDARGGESKSHDRPFLLE